MNTFPSPTSPIELTTKPTISFSVYDCTLVLISVAGRSLNNPVFIVNEIEVTEGGFSSNTLIFDGENSEEKLVKYLMVYQFTASESWVNVKKLIDQNDQKPI